MALPLWRKELGYLGQIVRGRSFQCLVQVTNRCNMRCDFCDFWPHGAKSQELSVAEYAEFATQLSDLGQFMISIEGGEPFVRPDLPDIIDVFSRAHLTVLFTNGWYVNADLAQRVFANGLNAVGVSIDYPDAAMHDQRRGLKGAFERACAAVEFFREAAPLRGKQVHVISVLMQENQDRVEELLELSRELKVGHYFTLISSAGYRRGDAAELPAPRPNAYWEDLLRRYRHLRVLPAYLKGISRFLEADSLPACNAGVASFNLDHVGNIAPCIEKIDQAMGNVRTQSVPELLAQLKLAPGTAGCQACWTLCRGQAQLLGQKVWSNLVPLVRRRHAV